VKAARCDDLLLIRILHGQEIDIQAVSFSIAGRRLLGFRPFFGSNAGISNSTGTHLTIIGAGANVGPDVLTYATAIGAGAWVTTSNTIALGRLDGSDKVVIYGLGAAGMTQLCTNISNQIATCSSSLRYKTKVSKFASGLNLGFAIPPKRRRN